MQFWINLQIMHFVVVINWSKLVFSKEPLQLSIEEETPINSVIVDIPQKYSSQYNSFFLEDKFFKITTNGKLLVKTKIDVDTICITDQKCCGETKCFIFITVFYKISPNDVDRFMNIKILIRDINDNFPQFSLPTQRLSVSEFAGIRKLISLQPAQDSDFDRENQIKNYTFFESTKTFGLDQDNIASPALIILKPLDFEKRKKYHASWMACDFKVKCTRQDILIEILDENDNTPKFNSNKISLKLPEDFPIGKVVIKLNATDEDSPPYNLVKYGFWESTADRNIKETFIVTENTGEIRLKQKLQTRIRTSYKFKIFAADSHSLNMEKDFVEIEIHVDDINDHAPKIDFVNVRSSIEVQENSDPGHILSIKVSDNDLGQNKNVSCSLAEDTINDFELVSINDQLYSLKSKKSFNYEKEKLISTVIICQDAGSPPKTSHKSVNINIIDENEFSPQFSESVYHQNVIENTPEGQYVIKVQAVDRDSGALLYYELEPSVRDYFVIDSLTGIIRTTSKIIDREKLEKLQFTVTVYDAKTNPNTGKATIVIIVVDENDNAPQFKIPFPSPRYSLLENSPPYTQITETIQATDADKSESNSKIQFSIEKAYNSSLHEISNDYFSISNIGKLSNLRKIDREEISNFTITLKIKDTGSPVLSSLLNITIYIDDINDNPPIWTSPALSNSQNFVLNISSETSVESILTVVKAVDADDGINGDVYYLIHGENSEILIINSSTGEIKLKRKLFHGSYTFYIKAYDKGKDCKMSKLEMLLNVTGDDMSILNSTIIVLLLTITGIVSLFLIIAITCVRRRPRYVPSFNQNGSDMEKSVQSSPTLKFEHQGNDGIMYPTSFDMLNITKSLPGQKDSIDRDSLMNSTLRTYNTNRYSEFTMAPNYFSSTINISGMTPTFRSNERDDDSADSGKGGSEDDIGLANLQMGQYGMDYMDPTNKGMASTSSCQNNRNHTMYRYNYRSRNPNTFYMVPEDDLVQNNSNSLLNIYPNNRAVMSCGSINKASIGQTMQNYSCGGKAYPQNIPNPTVTAFETSTFTNTLRLTNEDRLNDQNEQLNFLQNSSNQMCFDKS